MRSLCRRYARPMCGCRAWRLRLRPGHVVASSPALPCPAAPVRSGRVRSCCRLASLEATTTPHSMRRGLVVSRHVGHRTRTGSRPRVDDMTTPQPSPDSSPATPSWVTPPPADDTAPPFRFLLSPPVGQRGSRRDQRFRPDRPVCRIARPRVPGRRAACFRLAHPRFAVGRASCCGCPGPRSRTDPVAVVGQEDGRRGGVGDGPERYRRGGGRRCGPSVQRLRPGRFRSRRPGRSRWAGRPRRAGPGRPGAPARPGRPGRTGRGWRLKYDDRSVGPGAPVRSRRPWDPPHSGRSQRPKCTERGDRRQLSGIRSP